MKEQWGVAKSFGHFAQGIRLAHVFRFTNQRSQRRLIHAREPGGMAGDITNGDGPFGELGKYTTIHIHPFLDLHIGKLQAIFGKRVIQLKKPFFLQRHQCYARHRLGHRKNAYDGIAVHGPAGFAVSIIKSIIINFLPFFEYERGYAYCFTLIDIALQGSVNARFNSCINDGGACEGRCCVEWRFGKQ